MAQAERAGVEIVSPAWAGGVYEGKLVPVYQGNTMYRFRAGEIVVATGVIEQPLVFGRNDLPGVMLGSAARRLVNQFRIVPGERAVVVTADDLGIDAACDLAEGGMEVAAVADLRERDEDERLAMHGIEHLTGFAPVEARGRTEVTGLVVARGSERQTPPGRHGRHERRHGRPVGPPRPGRRQRSLRPRPPRLRARPGARRRARRRRGGRHRARRSRPRPRPPAASSSSATART